VIAPVLCLPLLEQFPTARRWVVAYSGGLDSHVLLHLCARLRAAHPGVPPVVALHVNHGVQRQADAWSVHCAVVCAELGIAFFARPAQLVALEATQPSEDELRAARYRVFAGFCAGDDLLLLAHHRDDQVETVLLRLLRGAGVAGLAGMPRERACGRARLCRPLLDIGRAQLREYAAAQGLRWVEDPSNACTEYDRNYLRRDVMPLLAARWPGAAGNVARAARNLAQAAAICAERAGEDLRECAGDDRFGQAFLALVPWRALGAARATAALRAWLAQHGAGWADAQSLATLEHEVIGARRDAQPRLVLGAVVVRRYRERLYAIPADGAGEAPAGTAIVPDAPLCLRGVGRIVLESGSEGGVRPGRDYRIGFGAPGWHCRPAGRPRKTLKQLAQEHGVPPWLRERLPLLYVDGELAAVAQLCVCEGFAAPPGTASLRLDWQPGSEGRRTPT
jgi:tRNA(Ile)-lysidine synthase